MRVSYLALALLIGAGAPGCKKIAGLVTEKVTGASNDPAKSSAAVEAMSHYAKGFNALIDRPQGLIKTYFDSVPQEGPEPDKKYLMMGGHLFAESKVKEAHDAFDAAAKAAPDSLKHLAPLAAACMADMDKIMVTFKSAYDYYQAEDFKDDKGQKGKALHADFSKLAASFHQNIGKLEEALSEIEAKQADEELKEYSDKTTYSHQFRFFNRQANKLVNSKPEKFLATFGEVDAAYTGLTAFTKSKGDLNTVFKSYAGSADSFYGAAKKLKREIESKGKEEDIDRDREQLTNEYNTLVSMANSLRDMEANSLLK